jgi:hypothetical protein
VSKVKCSKWYGNTHWTVQNLNNGSTKLWCEETAMFWWQIVRWCVKIDTICHKNLSHVSKVKCSKWYANTQQTVQNLTNRSTKLRWQKKPPCFDNKLFGVASKLSLFAVKLYHKWQRLSAQNDTPTLQGLCKISPMFWWQIVRWCVKIITIYHKQSYLSKVKCLKW